MRIILTGGGSGGHFYPLIAVADALRELAEERKFVGFKLIYMADDPYKKDLLDVRDIEFKKIRAGKLRSYFSIRNFTDSIKTIFGIFEAILIVFFNMPDVVFSKGGFPAFPVLLAARIFRIPVIIHESDVKPGRVNKWASKFAKRIAISFSETSNFFPIGKTALTGQPIRKEFGISARLGAKEYLHLEEQAPVILVLGGSLGSERINETITQVLPELVLDYQIIHQCGTNNLSVVRERTSVVLENEPLKARYHLFGFLNEDAIRMAYAIANIVVARAGSGSIFEIAISRLPSILIPLSGAAQDHQRANAYAYARTGAALVMEENNLKPHLLKAELDRLFNHPEQLRIMSAHAEDFAAPQAAEKIADAIIALALEHA